MKLRPQTLVFRINMHRVFFIFSIFKGFVKNLLTILTKDIFYKRKNCVLLRNYDPPKNILIWSEKNLFPFIGTLAMISIRNISKYPITCSEVSQSYYATCGQLRHSKLFSSLTWCSLNWCQWPQINGFTAPVCQYEVMLSGWILTHSALSCKPCRHGVRRERCFSLHSLVSTYHIYPLIHKHGHM